MERTMTIQPAKTADHATQTTLSLLQDLFGSSQEHNFAVRLWDGTTWKPEPGNKESPRFTLVLQHPGAIRSMFLPPSELNLFEAYMFNNFDVEGELDYQPVHAGMDDLKALALRTRPDVRAAVQQRHERDDRARPAQPHGIRDRAVGRRPFGADRRCRRRGRKNPRPPSPPELRGRGVGGEGAKPAENSRFREGFCPPHPFPLPPKPGGEGNLAAAPR